MLLPRITLHLPSGSFVAIPLNFSRSSLSQTTVEDSGVDEVETGWLIGNEASTLMAISNVVRGE